MSDEHKSLIELQEDALWLSCERERLMYENEYLKNVLSDLISLAEEAMGDAQWDLEEPDVLSLLDEARKAICTGENSRLC